MAVRKVKVSVEWLRSVLLGPLMAEIRDVEPIAKGTRDLAWLEVTVDGPHVPEGDGLLKVRRTTTEDVKFVPDDGR